MPFDRLRADRETNTDATSRVATTWRGMPSAALQAACLALRSREFNARRFGVHQVGVLVRQLVQNMQVLRANRLAKGRSHRPSKLFDSFFDDETLLGRPETPVATAAADHLAL